MGELPLFTIVKDILLFGIAAYSALLSTFNWRQARDRDRRKVLVKAGTTMLTYTNGQLGPPFARIEGINVGHRPVTITTLAFELPNKARIVATSWDNLAGMDDTRLPAKLSDGESPLICRCAPGFPEKESYPWTSLSYLGRVSEYG